MNHETLNTKQIGIGEYTDISNRTHLVRHCVIENKETDDSKEKLLDELFNVFTYKPKRIKEQ